jgi:low affinity Fe/Cu permease
MAALKRGKADGEGQANKNNNGAAHPFAEIANRTSQAAGRALTFLIAAGVVTLWALSGPIFHYSDTLQLVINTDMTIVPFLMVFQIQNSQHRGSAAIQVKLDELIRVSTARSFS